MAPLLRRSRFRAVAAAVLGLAVLLVVRPLTSSAAATPLAHPRMLLVIEPPVLLRVRLDCKRVCMGRLTPCRYLPGHYKVVPPPQCYGSNGEFLPEKLFCLGPHVSAGHWKKVCSPPITTTTHPPYDFERPPSRSLLEGKPGRLPTPSVGPRSPGLSTPGAAPRAR